MSESIREKNPGDHENIVFSVSHGDEIACQEIATHWSVAYLHLTLLSQRDRALKFMQVGIVTCWVVSMPSILKTIAEAVYALIVTNK